MEYAVYNLLTNAVKYSPPETANSRARAVPKDEHLRLSVEDQGMGMDREGVEEDLPAFLSHQARGGIGRARAAASGCRLSTRSCSIMAGRWK